ncbi:MAG: RiPP maturation radical SAM C-methyltransferase [Syntrophobacteraceae bacterium]|jgi:ribosomal peptide maturation radical SAM protein 1|nr:RiPP maturation radical SAM C-methyltransferase [Syntrophobacteraceae bacterium]
MGELMVRNSVERGWSPRNRVALVSAPWPLFSRPSIQLGTLKAFLGARIPGLRVDAHHLYLRLADAIGFELYGSISERSWLAECIYGALLFPGNAGSIERLFTREARGRSPLRDAGFHGLAESVRQVTGAILDETDWSAYGLAGFSASLCQLTASLHCIREIKKRAPGLPVVVGGSSWAGESCAAWLRHFPEIDAIVLGEGELPLTELVRHFQSPPAERVPLCSPAIVTREKVLRGEGESGFCQLGSLEELPTPDYAEYFETLRNLPSGRAFFPTLPVETSRGCWWRRPGRGGGGGCAFCNLNLQWEGYRSKGAEKVVAEIDGLTSRHRALSVAIVDNVLPSKDIPRVFGGLSHLGKDFRLFAEVRASISREDLEIMRKAGVEELQVGIEALSTRLLARMNKGSTTIQNLEIMKLCEELSILDFSNLILQFPGSDEEDVRETLKGIDFAEVYRPLRPVRFWLGLGSPVHRAPRSHGIRAAFNHPHYAGIFPKPFCREARFLIQGYRGDLGLQRRLWRPVVARIKAWERAYHRMRAASGGQPPLSYRDGGDFLLIQQFRPRGPGLNHRLSGVSREIYLHCASHRSVAELVQRFPKISEDRILPFLRGMVEKRLMFQEGDRFLSLAAALCRKSGEASF